MSFISNAQLLIPEITDEDIDWVCELMDLQPLDEPRCSFLRNRSTIDVTACPGSGKTTLIVAKLAILARKWPYRSKGICVLSHTNVAGEEIQHRLGSTAVGQRLLGYPHFIDTIHGFTNRFLAIPWLYSNGFPVMSIDDDITTAFRRRSLGDRYFILQNYLQKKYRSLEELRICNYDFSFDLNGKQFPASPNTQSYKLAQRVVEESASAGYFCYNEMFVWAKALLEEYPDLSFWLAQRFPLVFVDEMQDTSIIQCSLLNSVFPRQSDYVVVQRVGDPNQAIFDTMEAKASEIDPFPDTNGQQCINIQSSFRFGQDIANLASPFAVSKVLPSGLIGVGPKEYNQKSIPSVNTIFIFPDDQTNGVLDAYGRLVLEVLPDSLLKNGTVTAIGVVHRDARDVKSGDMHYPKTVSHYWDGYMVETSRKDPNPSTLAQYILVAQAIAQEKRDLSLAVGKIASGLLRLAGLIGDISNLKQKVRPHRAIMRRLEENDKVLEFYRRIIKLFLLENYAMTKKDWISLQNEFVTIACTLCEGETKLQRARNFLAWPKDEVIFSTPTSVSQAPRPNIYRVISGERHVDIRVGSIHSVKGQTHLATMLLDTYWHDHFFEKLLPWLLGVNVNGKGAGLRNQKRLLLAYVAMTRPSHLLCLALRRSTLGEGNFEKHLAKLQQQGWSIKSQTPHKPYT